MARRRLKVLQLFRVEMISNSAIAFGDSRCRARGDRNVTVGRMPGRTGVKRRLG